jgi:hypothetical protein
MSDIAVEQQESLVDQAVNPETVAPETAAPEVKVEKDADKFIPKGVFDNRLRGEREAREAAERRAQELEARLGQLSRTEDVTKAEVEITNLEKRHGQLLLEGDHEQAASIMRDIRLKERQISIQQANHMSTQTKDAAREEMRVEMVIERLEATHDILNPNHASYDQSVVDDVLGWQQVLIQRERLPPSKALAMAVDKVMRTGKNEAPSKAGLGAAAAGHDQVSKNLATDKAQPASLHNAGLDSDKAGINGKVDITKLTADEYAALPESTKAKLRGDVL